MKRRGKAFSWLLPVVAVLAIMIIALPGCGQGDTAPAGETTPAATTPAVETQTGDYQIAESDELRLELITLLNTAEDTGTEVADYCDSFWETWRDGSSEEMLQLAEDHPKMVTKVDESIADLNYVPTIINKTEELNIPDWYREYFSKKEQAAGHLNNAFQQAETFLAGVEPMIRDMSNFLSTAQGILEFWTEVAPEIGPLVEAKKYSEAREMVTTWTASVGDMHNLLINAYNQAKVPILQWFCDRCNPVQEALILFSDMLEAAEAGNMVEVEQMRDEIMDLASAEREAIESMSWDESNTWFNNNFGAYIDQATDSLAQAVSVNGEAELAYEAHWTPTAEELGQVFYASFVGETGDVMQWEEDTGILKVVGGHPDIDIKNAHTRIEGDNVIFWLEVEGSISDEEGTGYSFDICITPESKSGEITINYAYGKAYCYVRTTDESPYAEPLKSDGGLRIIVPKSALGSPEVWIFRAMAFTSDNLQDSVGELPPGLPTGD